MLYKRVVNAVAFAGSGGAGREGGVGGNGVKEFSGGGSARNGSNQQQRRGREGGGKGERVLWRQNSGEGERPKVVQPCRQCHHEHQNGRTANEL